MEVHSVTRSVDAQGLLRLLRVLGRGMGCRSETRSPIPMRRQSIERLTAAERVLEFAGVFMVAPEDRRSKVTVGERAPWGPKAVGAALPQSSVGFGRAADTAGAFCAGCTGVAAIGTATIACAGVSATDFAVAALTQTGAMSVNDTGSLQGSGVRPRTLRTRATHTPTCAGPSPVGTCAPRASVAIDVFQVVVTDEAFAATPAPCGRDSCRLNSTSAALPSRPGR